MEYPYVVTSLLIITMLVSAGSWLIIERTSQAIAMLKLPLEYQVRSLNITSNNTGVYIVMNILFKNPLTVEGYRLYAPRLHYSSVYKRLDPPYTGVEYSLVHRIPVLRGETDSIYPLYIYLLTSQYGLIVVKAEHGVEDYDHVYRLSREAYEKALENSIHIRQLEVRVEDINNTVMILSDNVSTLMIWRNSVEPYIGKLEKIINNAEQLLREYPVASNVENLTYMVMRDYIAVYEYVMTGEYPPPSPEYSFAYHIIQYMEDVEYLMNKVDELETRIQYLEGNMTEVKQQIRSITISLENLQQRIEALENIIGGTILYEWNAVTYMDIENNAWWHGDTVGLIYFNPPPDTSHSIAGGNIEIPKWENGQVTISFYTPIPRIYDTGLTKDGFHLKILLEALLNPQTLIGGVYRVDMSLDVFIYYVNGSLRQQVYGYSVTVPIYFDHSGYMPTSIVIDFSSGNVMVMGEHNTTIASIDKLSDLKAGLYEIDLSVHIYGVGNEQHFALKTVAVYLSPPG